jgi:hydrogenase nickel incorporation protein HypA/HybF
MSQLVDIAIQSTKEHNVEKVHEIYIEVGELTALAHEQLQFAYQLLTENNNILSGSKLIIEVVKTRVRCSTCNYEGGVKYIDDPIYHYIAPQLTCPLCNNAVTLLAGRECKLKHIKLTVRENDKN